MSIIVLYTVAVPVVSVVGELSEISLGQIWDVGDIDPDIDAEEYIKVAENAFADGIKAAVADRYRLDKEDINVRVIGFDFENMRAQRIRIILSGYAALSDFRGIADYITGSGLGECEVKVEIG